MTQTPPTPYRLPWIKKPNKPIGKFKYQSYDAALIDRVLAVQTFFHFFKTNTKLFIRNTALSASMQDQSTNT
jgi:urease beta subunit